jgi:hypothetical protein
LTLPICGNAADVVARQIDQHQVFGALLRIRGEFGGEHRVLLGCIAARACSRDRADRHHALAGAILAAHQDLRRGPDHMEVAEVVEIHVRRRVQRPQRAIQRER